MGALNTAILRKVLLVSGTHLTALGSSAVIFYNHLAAVRIGTDI